MLMSANITKVGIIAQTDFVMKINALIMSDSYKNKLVHE